jgi:hypothetical protein
MCVVSAQATSRATLFFKMGTQIASVVFLDSYMGEQLK